MDDTTFGIVVFLIIWLFFSGVAAAIAQKKGKALEAFLLAVLLSPLIGILYAVFTKGVRKQCSFCKEWIHPSASVCPHCRNAVEMVTPTTSSHW